MPKISSLVENFNGSIDSSLWDNQGGANIVFDDGQLKITTNTTSGYLKLVSQDPYDLTNDALSVQVVDSGDLELESLETAINLKIDDDNSVFFNISGYDGTVGVYRRISGTNTLMKYEDFDSEVHKWLRIRERNGVLYFESSSDGKIWRNIHSVTNPIAITSLYVELYSGIWGSESTTSTAIFDNLNVLRYYPESRYTITINGVDRTSCISNRTLSIIDSSDSEPSTCNFSMEVRDGGSIPSGDQEVIITDGLGSRLFGGRILKCKPKRLASGVVVWSVECIDWNRDLDRNLVVESYENMTDAEIIADIINNYCGGSGFDVNNVTESVTISQVVFNYVTPSQCFDEICKFTGRSWHCDYDKSIHYYSRTDNPAPFNIDSNSANYSGLSIDIDNSVIRNRVYVRGGTKLSDSTTITMSADGEQTVFNLPDKPHEFSMTVGGVSKTVGIKNVDDPADYDYLLNFQEKYVECGSGETAPSVGTVMSFTYKYDIPILVALEDSDSIAEVGQFEYAIFDNNIKTTSQARNRASAELTDYGNSVSSGGFRTLVNGFRAGQYMTIDIPEMGVDDTFIVKSVNAKSIGGGDFEYSIQVTSAKIMGILQFLIKMLEDDKNSLDISSDEVVDELNNVAEETFTISDGTPTISSHTGAYKYDIDGEYKVAEWS